MINEMELLYMAIAPEKKSVSSLCELLRDCHKIDVVFRKTKDYANYYDLITKVKQREKVLEIIGTLSQAELEMCNVALVSKIEQQEVQRE